MNVQSIKLPEPQLRLVKTPSKFPAMVAGFGAGKTNALMNRALAYKFRYKELNHGYYLPTFDLVRTIAFPRFEELLTAYDIPYKTVYSQTPKIKLENAAEIIFRTMDSPSRIIGYEVADSSVDELDTLKEADAKAVWEKIIARNRQKKPDGLPNTAAVGTTPEGFGFCYKMWGREPLIDGYELIPASTYSNAHNLPADYIDNLKALYPAALVDAYIYGKFTNLKQGTVYGEFSRVLNASSEEIKPDDILFIGLDFNVMKMAAIIFVMREGNPHAVAELTNMFDTPAAIATIKEKWPRHRICIYPDASGGARKSNDASVTDLALLRQAGFEVYANPSNPRVRDRVLAVCCMINSGGGGRRLRVNLGKCPTLAECLEKQAYDENGEPDKKSGLDHPNDALGYFIAYTFPVVNGMAQVQISGY